MELQRLREEKQAYLSKQKRKMYTNDGHTPQNNFKPEVINIDNDEDKNNLKKTAKFNNENEEEEEEDENENEDDKYEKKKYINDEDDDEDANQILLENNIVNTNDVSHNITETSNVQNNNYSLNNTITLFPNDNKDNQPTPYGYLSKNYLFSIIDTHLLYQMCTKLTTRVIKEGNKIITKGDKSNNEMYVVINGEFQAIENKQTLHIYREYDSFGELSLLYNTKRAITIIATKQSEVYIITKELFDFYIKSEVEKKLSLYEKAITFKYPLFDYVSRYNIKQLSMCVNIMRFNQGDIIIFSEEKSREDDIEDESIFYIVDEGEIFAYYNEGKTMLIYKEGDYFNELNMIYDSPSYIKAIAKTDCKLFTFTKCAFKQILQNVEPILLLNAKTYSM